MSVKVHEAFSIDSFQDRLLWFDDFLGDQLQDEWRVVTTGTTAVNDAQTGGIVRLTTGAVDTNAEYRDWSDIRSLHVDQKVTMEVRLKANQITYLFIGIRLFFDGNNNITFYASENAGGATNWRLFTVSGGANTDVDSGITLDTDYHIFRIECFPTDEVHFYIDDVEPGTSPITTNIPNDAGDYLQPYLYIDTKENVAKSMDIDYVVVRQEI